MIINMLAVVLIVGFGLLFSFFSTQNTELVTIRFASYEIGRVPIYALVLISMIAAFTASGILYAARTLSDSLTMGDKDKSIKNLKQELAESVKKVHKLELENTRLKSKNGENVDEDSIP